MAKSLLIRVELDINALTFDLHGDAVHESLKNDNNIKYLTKQIDVETNRTTVVTFTRTFNCNSELDILRDLQQYLLINGVKSFRYKIVKSEILENRRVRIRLFRIVIAVAVVSAILNIVNISMVVYDLNKKATLETYLVAAIIPGLTGFGLALLPKIEQHLKGYWERRTTETDS